jgi:hypothetical protein
MKKVHFRYKAHPGDLFRNADVVALPNPDENLEDFLIWFLNGFQLDQRLTYINDLAKLLDDEFLEDADRDAFIAKIGNKTNDEIKEAIVLVENELKIEAYENFYHLVSTNDIEILNDYEG